MLNEVLEIVDTKVLVAENSSPGSACKGRETKTGQTLACDTVNAELLAVHPACRQAAATHVNVSMSYLTTVHHPLAANFSFHFPPQPRKKKAMAEEPLVFLPAL